MATSPQAWLLLAVGEDRQHSGNSGYEDDPSSLYRWDSTVSNHVRIRVGDRVVIWNKKTSLGASVVDAIQIDEGIKPVFRCPDWGLSGIKPRRTRTPLYHCHKCGAEFDPPVTQEVEITSHTAGYEPGWVDLEGLVDGSTLRRPAISPRSQLNLRPMNWEQFASILRSRAPGVPLPLIDIAAAAATDSGAEQPMPGGHATSVVRTRRGQGEFRRRLIARFGAECAFTGPAPLPVLEAAHLYKYADRGRHEIGGGLLLRRDIHALFDAGLLSVQADRVRVHSSLTAYPAYVALDGRAILPSITAAERAWLADHRRQAEQIAPQVAPVATHSEVRDLARGSGK